MSKAEQCEGSGGHDLELITIAGTDYEHFEGYLKCKWCDTRTYRIEVEMINEENNN